MEQIIVELVQKFPIAASIVGVVGVARIIFKPLMTFAHAIVDATSSQKDNEFLIKVEGSKIYKGVAYVMDYLVSIKLPK